jgi:prevent-host-death family protein
MTSVGIRELKNRLSQYLRRAGRGERLVVTDRGRPLAVISPPARTPADEAIEHVLRQGLAEWGGGKPRGSRRPPKITGQSIAQIVLEERR